MPTRNFAVALLAMILACSSSATVAATPPAVDGGAGADAGSDAAEPGPGPVTLATAKGTISETITLTAAGTKPCALTLTIDAVEDRSVPWLCPKCKVTYHSAFTATPDSDTACSAQVVGPGDSRLPADVFIGWEPDGKLHVLQGFRGAPENGTVAEKDSVADLTIVHSGEGGSVAGTGRLTLGTTTGDPLGGFAAAASYACKWPKSNPPAYQGNYVAKVGGKVPDAVLLDQCGDHVRLHDLLGRYLVFELSVTQKEPCGPCAAAAADQKVFEAAMKTAGIETLVVALQTPNLAAPGLSPAPADLKSWVTANGVAGVALADRGFGELVLGPTTHQPEDPSAVPAFVLVAPDGTIIEAFAGYYAEPANPAQNSWADLEAKIRAHAGR